jgi:hypothetical protein
VVQSSISFTVDGVNFCGAVGEQIRERFIVTTFYHLKYSWKIPLESCKTQKIEAYFYSFFLE